MAATTKTTATGTHRQMKRMVRQVVSYSVQVHPHSLRQAARHDAARAASPGNTLNHAYGHLRICRAALAG
jgi:hypothetical protein